MLEFWEGALEEACLATSDAIVAYDEAAACVARCCAPSNRVMFADAAVVATIESLLALDDSLFTRQCKSIDKLVVVTAGPFGNSEARVKELVRRGDFAEVVMYGVERDNTIQVDLGEALGRVFVQHLPSFLVPFDTRLDDVAIVLLPGCAASSSQVNGEKLHEWVGTCLASIAVDLGASDDVSVWGVGECTNAIAQSIYTSVANASLSKSGSRVSFLVIDRESDMAASCCFDETAFGRMLRCLPRAHRIDLLFDTPLQQIWAGESDGDAVVSGTLYHPLDPQWMQLMDTCTHRSVKETMSAFRTRLLDALETSGVTVDPTLIDSPVSQDVLTRLTHTAAKTLTLAERCAGLMDLAAAIGAVSSPRNSERWDKYARLEKIVMESAQGGGDDVLHQLVDVIHLASSSNDMMEHMYGMCVCVVGVSVLGSVQITGDGGDGWDALYQALITAEKHNWQPMRNERGNSAAEIMAILRRIHATSLTAARPFRSGEEDGCEYQPLMRLLMRAIFEDRANTKVLSDHLIARASGAAGAAGAAGGGGTATNVAESTQPSTQPTSSRGYGFGLMKGLASGGLKTAVNVGSGMGRYMGLSSRKPQPTDANVLVVYVHGGLAQKEIHLTMDFATQQQDPKIWICSDGFVPGFL